ncbi:hypothetical protein ACNTMW_02945 [Planosporangium sp. 12N6]|uniref:hypothetical protein n=1 Tax=Planosporangium spinosum TaxID=3402278 RepID=UPI003CEBC64B
MVTRRYRPPWRTPGAPRRPVGTPRRSMVATPRRRLVAGLVAAAVAVAAATVVGVVAGGTGADRHVARFATPAPSDQPNSSALAVPASPSVTPPARDGLLIGIGDEADRASGFALTRQAPVRMLTSWYNRPEDLGDFMAGWRTTWVPRLYAQGYALHLVVWSGDAEGPVSTKYGAACGRRYPLSTGFLDDIRRVAQVFAGPRTGPPLYVTLFTEFSTYPCVDNEWSGDPRATAYYLALKDQYRAAYDIFHRVAANARVSLGFGGWLATYDYPAKGGGRSLLNHFTDLMAASDFQSFQAMDDNGGNPDQIRAMTKILGRYGPVMVAHYKPDNGSRAMFAAEVRQIFTDAYLRDVIRDGLFAMSFMTNDDLAADPTTFRFVRDAVARYGRDH